jgi:hypothetical protein
MVPWDFDGGEINVKKSIIWYTTNKQHIVPIHQKTQTLAKTQTIGNS